MKDIQLFINGMEVEFSSSPDILFTFQVDEVTNPTIVKNSYSKTLTIDGTPTNNEVFGQIWSLERIHDTDTFNPSKKAPFIMYHNGSVYQEGYVKLLQINRNGNHITYDISLFGGLGDFFYSLQYNTGDDAGESSKKQMSDLYFGTNPNSTNMEDEFDFTINKNTVSEAWASLGKNTNSLWNTLNFAPAYNGLPDDFDANKVLINASGIPSIKSSYTSGGVTYRPYNNHILAELPKDLTEWEIRDLRSYLQRPVLRVKDTIKAICNPINNGGYEVELDPDFFNANNPYYEKAWMTLPMLGSLDFDSKKDTQAGRAVALSNWFYRPSGYVFQQKTDINVSDIPEDATSYNLSMQLTLDALLEDFELSDITTNSSSTKESNELVTAASKINETSNTYLGAIEVQIVAYDQNGRAVAGSENIHVTNIYQHKSVGSGSGNVRPGQSNTRPSTNDVIPTMADVNFTPEYAGVSSRTELCYFKPKDTNNKRNWELNQELSLTIKNVRKTNKLQLVITKVNNSPNLAKDERYSRALFQPYYNNNNELRHRRVFLESFLPLCRMQVTVNSAEAIRSGTKFKKADLLNTDYTPADFLLSYGKLFGLYFSKDKVERKIYIRKRKNFYSEDWNSDRHFELAGKDRIEKQIDRNKEMNISPIVFETKWYNFNLQQEDGQFAEQYKNTYGIDFGLQKVNTGYNFDGGEKDLLAGNIFKTAVEAQERSNMYSYYGIDLTERPWMFNGYNYLLYAQSDPEQSTEVTVNSTSKINQLKSFNTLKYYDLFPKVQLHSDNNDPSDGSNILLFFDGFEQTKSKANGDDITYYLTDDSDEMRVLNDETPCWYFTSQPNTNAILLDSIPHFGRYIINDATNKIITSWDFGEPKQLYVPNIKSTSSSTIYTQFWKRYIADLYDIDTRKVSCYVNFKEEPDEEYLRRFFYFDNSIWRINQIIDCNASSYESTKVEFIKVNDIEAYTTDDFLPESDIKIYFAGQDYSDKTISNNGETVTVYVQTTGEWYLNDELAPYADKTSGRMGNGGIDSFKLTIPANTKNNSRVFSVTVDDGNGNYSNTLNIIQNSTVLWAEWHETWRDINMPRQGGVAMLIVHSTTPFTINANTDYVELSSYSGEANPTYGVGIAVSWSASNMLSERTTKFTINDNLGNVFYISKAQDGYSVSTKGEGGTYEPLDGQELRYIAAGETKIVYYDSGKLALGPEWISIVDNGDNSYSITAYENRSYERTSTIIFQGGEASDIYYIRVVQDPAENPQDPSTGGLGRNIDITPKVWFYNDNGGNQILTITNTKNHNWSFHNVPSWITIDKMTGNSEKTVNAIAQTNNTDERESVIIFYDIDDDETIALYCKQDKGQIIANLKSIELRRLDWIKDIPYSGGTVGLDNLSYSVYATFDDGSEKDITAECGKIVTADKMNLDQSKKYSRESIGNVTLTVSYGGMTDSKTVEGFQQRGNTPVSLDVDYEKDYRYVPSEGGYVYASDIKINKATVTYYYGQTIDVTNDLGVAFEIGGAPTNSIFIQSTDEKDNRIAKTVEVQFTYDEKSWPTSFYQRKELNIWQKGTEEKYLKITSPKNIELIEGEECVDLNIESNTIFEIKIDDKTDYHEIYVDVDYYTKEPLTFKFEEDGVLDFVSGTDGEAKVLKYRKNDDNFSKEYEIVSSEGDGTHMNVKKGDIIKFYGNNNSYRSANLISRTAKYELCGNIMSLLYGYDFADKTELTADEVFKGIFSGGYATNAINLILPSKKLTRYCYQNMFSYNKHLINAPVLIGETIKVDGCYYSMFIGCEKLRYVKCLDSVGNGTSNNWLDGVSREGRFITYNHGGHYFGGTGIPNEWELIEYGEWISVSPYKGGSGDSTLTICFNSYLEYNYDFKATLTAVDELNDLSDSIEVVGIPFEMKLDEEYSNQPLTFKITEGGTINFGSDSSSNYKERTIKYKKSDDNFTKEYEITSNWTGGTPIEVKEGDIIKIYGYNSNYYGNRFIARGARYEVYGNIMSLVYDEDFIGKSLIPRPDNAFAEIFSGNGVTEAKNLILPSKILQSKCYSAMFKNNTTLINGPTLYSYHNAYFSCSEMFYGCSNLHYVKCLTYNISNPDWLYGTEQVGLFIKSPKANSYSRNNSGIRYDWTIIDDYEFSEYEKQPLTFKVVKSGSIDIKGKFIKYRRSNDNFETEYTNKGEILGSSTPINVEEGDIIRFYLENDQTDTYNFNTPKFVSNGAKYEAYGNIMSLFYGYDFIGKTRITNEGSFREMFSGNGVIDAKNLILSLCNLTKNCYRRMFYNDTDLLNAPVLRAYHTFSDVYGGMFGNCSKLSYIKCLTNGTSFDEYLAWTENVSPTGTFIKKKGVEWPTGSSGIPIGWNIINAEDIPDPNFTGLEIINLTWKKDISADGGSVTLDNVSYNVVLTYDDGLKFVLEQGRDDFSVSISDLTVGKNETSERKSIGIVTLTAEYKGLKAIASIEGFQAENRQEQDFENEPLTFKVVKGGKIYFVKDSTLGSAQQITYKTSKENFTIEHSLNSDYNGAEIPVEEGELIKVYSNRTSMSQASFNTDGALFDVQGNILSLVYGEDFIGKEEPDSFSFRDLFSQKRTFVGGVVDALNLVLPKTKAPASCYRAMFYNNQQMTYAPPLYVKTLDTYSYAYMFENCEKLKYVKCLAQDISASLCTFNWLRMSNSGVNDGTFIKAAGVSWLTGKDGIPTGWEIIEE